MLENLLKEINPFYSEPIINHIILSVSIIVAGMFLLSYGIKKINSSSVLKKILWNIKKNYLPNSQTNFSTY